MSRLLLVSNRLPVSVRKVDGQLSYKRSVGGVATGLSSLKTPVETFWIGWPGIARDELTPEDERVVADYLTHVNCSGVHLSAQAVEEYYLGFSNKTIWPLFHYFPLYCEFNQDTWQKYIEVNESFFR